MKRNFLLLCMHVCRWTCAQLCMRQCVWVCACIIICLLISSLVPSSSFLALLNSITKGNQRMYKISMKLSSLHQVNPTHSPTLSLTSCSTYSAIDYTKPKMSMPLMKDVYTSYPIHPIYCLSHSHVNSHSRSLRVSHRIKYLHVLDCLCCALHKLQCSCPLAKDIHGVW